MASDTARRRPPSWKTRTKKAFESRVRAGLRGASHEATPAPLLVGFSGGADSTALLLSVQAVLRESQPLRAVHVEHGLRGRASERDARHAESVCREFGVDFCCKRVRVPQQARWGLEGAARESRRAAFLEVARETGACALALAHTRDDQAETVLMRLFEGAGARGMAGMGRRTPLASQEGGGLRIIRPLLDLSRAEILEYLEARGVSWVEDETNRDETRLRNRIRRSVIPAIREHLGYAAVRGIAKSAEISAPLASLVDAMAADAGARLIQETDGEVVVSPLREVENLNRAVRAGVWRAALEALGCASPARPRRRALRRWIEGLDRLAKGRGNPSGTLSLPDGMEARREYDRLLLGRARVDARWTEERRLRIPGRTAHRALGLAIEASRGGAHRPELSLWEARLDPEKLGADARIRTRRDGDRFHPPGREKERKLKDYLMEQKIPKPMRHRLPLLAVREKVAWIIGHRVSAEFACGPQARGGVVLQAVRAGGRKGPPARRAPDGRPPLMDGCE